MSKELQFSQQLQFVEIEQEKKKRLFIKPLKIIGYVIISFLLLVSAAVSIIFIYQDEIKAVILKELNKNLKSEVKIAPENIDITILKSFPDCSIEFKDLLMLEAIQSKKRDTLLFAEQLNLHFNFTNIWNKKYEIDKIKLKNSVVRLHQYKNGTNNYTFWKSSANINKSDSLNFKLSSVFLENIHIQFKNNLQQTKASILVKTTFLKGNFSQDNYDLSVKGEIEINQITQRKNTILHNKSLDYNLDLAITGSNYVISASEIKLNDIAIKLNGNFCYKDSLENAKIKFDAPDLNIESVLSLLPKNFNDKINDYKSSGNFYLNGDISYLSTKNYRVSTLFGIKNSNITYKPNNTIASNANLDGSLFINQNQNSLNIQNFSCQINEDKIQGRISIENFNAPKIDCKLQANIHLENFQKFIPIDTIVQMNGLATFSLLASGNLQEIQKLNLSNTSFLFLKCKLDSIHVQFKNDDKKYNIQTCRLNIVQHDIEFDSLVINRGESDLTISGKIPGLLKMMNDKNYPLFIEGKLVSNKINIQDFMPKVSSNSTVSSKPLIPENIEFKLETQINNFVFGKFEAKNIQGNIECKNQKLFANEVSVQCFGGDALINLFADNSKDKLEVAIQSNLKNINITTLFSQLNNFGQSSLMDKNLNGIASATVDFSAIWSNDLVVDEKSIASVCNLNIEKGELIDFNPLMSLAKYVDVKELQRIKFSTLSSTIEIKDRKIIIPQTSINNSALNINFWGSQTFDYDIDYHIQLSINEYLRKKRKQSNDEFGPVENDASDRRSAFILMTGNIDNPIIKYDKKGLKQKIKADIKQEKQTLKQILKEEFGLFKNDTIMKSINKKADQKFELEKPPHKKNSEKSKDQNDDEDF